MKDLCRVLIFFLSVYLFAACNEAKIPLVTTNTVTGISTMTAVSGGVITDDGGGKIIAKGLCWDTTGRPKISSDITADTTESLSFTSHMTGLSPKTTYYVRAYATNIAGTGYGKMETFITLGDRPSLSILDATSIEPYSATLNGTVNPNLLTTAVEFEYGTSTSYGNTIVPAQGSVSGDTEVTVSADLTGLTPGTTYHARIKAENPIGTMYSNDITFKTTGKVPDAETAEVTDLKLSSVKLNASVNPNYLATTVVFEWGATAYYGNSVPPAENIITGSSPVNISAVIDGLTPGTIYHFRIKATNELGTSSGGDHSFKTYVVEDADNNYYYSVTIGTQTWMLENLKTTRLRDGTAIQSATDNTAWKNLASPGYCWYDNNEAANKRLFGVLYNWYTVNTGKLCPAGWHVPTNAEWITLTNYLGGESVAGTKLKETGSTNWGALNTGTNETGFTALPGGNRDDTGAFAGKGLYAQFWSMSTVLPTISYYAVLYHNSPSLVRGSNPNVFGLSVRCIRD